MVSQSHLKASESSAALTQRDVDGIIFSLYWKMSFLQTRKGLVGDKWNIWWILRQARGNFISCQHQNSPSVWIMDVMPHSDMVKNRGRVASRKHIPLRYVATLWNDRLWLLNICHADDCTNMQMELIMKNIEQFSAWSPLMLLDTPRWDDLSKTSVVK